MNFPKLTTLSLKKASGELGCKAEAWRLASFVNGRCGDSVVGEKRAKCDYPRRRLKLAAEERGRKSERAAAKRGKR